MEDSRLRISTRRALLGALFGALVSPRVARAFGQAGAFHARRLTTGTTPEDLGVRTSALGHWAWELVRRTSAPGRLHTDSIAADAPALLHEPFCVWAGARAVEPLMQTELRGLSTFFQLGGVLLVDDADPSSGEFGRSVQRELQRVLKASPIVKLPPTHVLYKAYYLVDAPVGRESGSGAPLMAMFRGRQLQVILSSHDLLGALARQGDTWALPMAGGPDQRQLAVRLMVNIAMYVLCSDYKDDQVHAQELMRRRGRYSAPSR